MTLKNEERIFAETPVRFDVAPAIERDGKVWGQFRPSEESELQYILEYMAGDEATYVCRRKGQFKITGEPPQ